MSKLEIRLSLCKAKSLAHSLVGKEIESIFKNGSVLRIFLKTRPRGKKKDWMHLKNVRFDIDEENKTRDTSEWNFKLFNSHDI